MKLATLLLELALVATLGVFAIWPLVAEPPWAFEAEPTRCERAFQRMGELVWVETDPGDAEITEAFEELGDAGC